MMDGLLSWFGVFESQQRTGPSRIRPGLFLGGLEDARDLPLLRRLGVKAVLTINTRDLQQLPADEFLHLFCEADDDMEHDVIQFFPAAVDFIARGVAAGGVLVHCFFGVSRSATLVAAYLMAAEKLSAKAALASIKEQRSFVSPNPNFLSQLKMFERMNNRVDEQNAHLRNFRLYHVARRVQSSGSPADAPQAAFSPDPGPPGAETTFRCRRCRRTLFKESTLMQHNTPAELSPRPGQDFCRNELFTEPVEWMRSVVLGGMEGKLHCPGCKAKVGSFTWLGEKCSCMSWVCPAFHMRSQAVDRIVPRKNEAAAT